MSEQRDRTARPNCGNVKFENLGQYWTQGWSVSPTTAAAEKYFTHPVRRQRGHGLVATTSSFERALGHGCPSRRAIKYPWDAARIKQPTSRSMNIIFWLLVTASDGSQEKLHFPDLQPRPGIPSGSSVFKTSSVPFRIVIDGNAIVWEHSSSFFRLSATVASIRILVVI
jgi:hypothetical protein